MIDKTNIENTIKDLDIKYNNKSSTNNEILLFSKLAVMEFCGWIEQSFDQILTNYLNNKNIGTKHIDYANTIIDSVHGFGYDTVRNLFLNILGIKNIETIENSIGSDLVQLKPKLNDWLKKRHSAAHTYVSGTQQNYPAPSEVLNNLNILFPIMQKLETEVNRL